MPDGVPESVLADLTSGNPMSRESTGWLCLNEQAWPDLWELLTFDVYYFLPPGVYSAQEVRQAYRTAADTCCGTEFRLKVAQWYAAGALTMPHDDWFHMACFRNTKTDPEPEGQLEIT